MHGESPDQAAGPVCGIILQAAEEPVLYVAGDTVYYKGVEQALEQYRPDVVVLNACGADGAWAPYHGGRGCFEGMRGHQRPRRSSVIAPILHGKVICTES